MGYNPVMLFVKLSLFFLYLHLFGASRRIRILVYVGIASIIAFYTRITVAYGVRWGRSSDDSWFKIIVASRCAVPTRTMNYIVGSFGVISDFYILGLPIPVILRLQLPRREKIEVCALFMTGFL